MTVAVCAACLGAVHFGGEPDFPYHPAREGEDCGAADHVALTETETPMQTCGLTKNGTEAKLVPLDNHHTGTVLMLLRLSYPRGGDDYVGEIDDDELRAWALRQLEVSGLKPEQPLTGDTLRWEATERATTTGTIVDLAMVFFVVPR